MFNFLTKLFSKKNEYSTGAIIPVSDPRNIDIGEIQQPIEIPVSYKSELAYWEVKNQGNHPACVGFTFSQISEFIFFKRTGKKIKVDGLELYAKAKKEDGIPEQSGTYPNVMAKIVTRDGVRDENGNICAISNGYAFVPVYDFELLSQAIYQNGAVATLFIIDKNWFIGIIGRLLQRVGGHEVTLYGYEKGPISILKGINSWGIGWIGRIASMLDRNVTAGHFEAKYEDVKDSLISAIVLLPIPQKILDEVKNIDYKFLNTMKKGSKGYEVKKLQERLNILPADGIFGEKTRQAVMTFQFEKGLFKDGVVGVSTLKALNGITTKSFIPLLAKAIREHEGWFPPSSKYPNGSRSWRNKSPANFKLQKGRTITEYMKKLGGISLDKDGFVIFPTEEIGNKALCSFLEDACSGKLRSYTPDMTLYEFFKKYAPSTDHNNPLAYATIVAKKIGCSIDTKIYLLL
jgi:hypothetical protein